MSLLGDLVKVRARMLASRYRARLDFAPEDGVLNTLTPPPERGWELLFLCYTQQSVKPKHFVQQDRTRRGLVLRQVSLVCHPIEDFP